MRLRRRILPPQPSGNNLEIKLAKNLLQKTKHKIFKLVEPAFIRIRDGLVFLKILRHKGRQDYFIGFLKKNKTADDFAKHLHQLGFRKHRIAWVDDGELFGMRLLVSWEFSYHIRLFKDGEIRGHYERTVECHPFKHFFEIDMEQKTEEFKRFVSAMLEPVEAAGKSVAKALR